MKEAEWIANNDPKPMASFLSGVASDRKLWLFGAGCCRSVWCGIEREEFRRALEGLEELLEGRYASVKQITSLYEPGASPAEQAVYCLSFNCRPFYNFRRSVLQLVASVGSAGLPPEAITSLLRCVGGNPFRRFMIDSGWLTWSGGVISTLVEDIYDSRSFDRLPILADALEEAGCTDAVILAHCRGPGPHFRGCWVVDLLLGKS